MADLRFYNTLTRQKEQFTPIDAKNIRIYVCGPTVYDYAHIGNARPLIVFDVLFRLMRAVYGKNHVRYVRNITDVDDKINARAARDYPDLPLNEAIRRLTKETERQFQDDAAALNCLKPTLQPRATDYIGKMRALIERLLENGHAYVAENHILFSVPAMNKTAKKSESGRSAAVAGGDVRGNPLYGLLSRRAGEELQAGARVEVESYKRDLQDFVLWKPSAANEPGWESPDFEGNKIEGLGRPGWHIECSAMSMGELLEPFGGGLQCDDPHKNCFDIHGGGLDLIFPHHENEIAQSCCALDGRRMANFWLHNGFVQVEGQKMSKSLGNFITIRQILETPLPQFSAHVPEELRVKWAGLAARFAMLQTHYRKPLDWTKEKLEASSAELYRWHQLLRENDKIISEEEGKKSEFFAALADDLNTPAAIAEMRRFYAQGESGKLASAMSHLGLLEEIFLEKESPLFIREAALAEAEIEAAVEKRAKAIEAKNWREADRIRDELAAKGIKLRDEVDKATGKRIVKWD